MTYQATILADTPTYYWTFDNGTTADDIVGGNSGTLTTDANVFIMPGGNTNCLYRSPLVQAVGSSNHGVTLTTPILINPSLNYSLEAWVFIPPETQARGYSSRFTVSPFARFIGAQLQSAPFSSTVSTAGGLDMSKAFVVVRDSAAAFNAEDWYSPLGIIPRGQWSHIVITNDYYVTGSKLYVNGILAERYTQTSIQSLTNLMAVGTCAVDEIAFYNYPLTATQVLNHFNAGSGFTNPTFPTFNFTIPNSISGHVGTFLGISPTASGGSGWVQFVPGSFIAAPSLGLTASPFVPLSNALSNSITGTPTAAGTFPCSIQATSGLQTITASFTITVT